ncbi:HAMP domain-containing sensor histidine kinase, partial [Helicobacter typhlonius]
GECSNGVVNVSFSEDEAFWCFIFSDNGASIADKNLLFEPFKTTKLKGNGLGLALCQQIVNAHNGSISLNENTDDKIFYIKIAKS